MNRPRWMLALGASTAVGVASVALAFGALDRPATVDETAVRVGNAAAVDPPPPAATARYRVSFVVTWGATTHPTTLPPGSHVSPAIVAVHSEPGDMFANGSLASPGIERMAEVGATSTLTGELAGGGSVADIQTGRRIDGPGTDTFEFDVTQVDRYVSLVSMLAPSPDWFVGTDSLDLFEGGDWVTNLDVPLGAYDAGTDSGANFTSSNADTSPAEVISGPRDASFQAAAAEGVFGRLVIERIG